MNSKVGFTSAKSTSAANGNTEFFIKCTTVVAAILVGGLLTLGLRRYYQGAKCTIRHNLRGKTIVLTGGNTGVGKAVAIELAKREAKVIIGCRDELRGAEAERDIRIKSGSKEVYVKKLDLSSLQSVKFFADNILSECHQLDMLINNAAVICPKYTSVDGFDLQWSVNYLGHFLLTNLLLDRLKESAPSKIINVGSRLMAKSVKFDDLMFDNEYIPMKAYSHTKLALHIFTTHLSELLRDSQVTVISASPGHVWTHLNRHIIKNFSKLKKIILYAVFLVVAKSPWYGAQSILHCCLAEEEKMAGKFFRECGNIISTPQAEDRVANERLWKISFEQSHVRTIQPNDEIRMKCPSGMAVDLTNNIFYVADWLDYCILRFDKDLKFIDKFPNTSITSPRGVRCKGDLLYVAESDGNTKRSCIKVLDFDGNLKLKFGEWGSNTTFAYIRPLTLNIDENDNIYICDSGNKKIDIISGSGEYLTSFGTGDLEWPIDILIRDNLIYVLDFTSPAGILLVYEREFNLVTKSYLYNNCRAPYFILDENGELTFSDKHQKCLWHYSTEGTVSKLDSVATFPKGLVLDNNSRIVYACM